MKIPLFLKYVNNSKGELISVMGNIYSPVVTKNELIDIIYKSFKSSISKSDLEKIMDRNIKLEDKDNKIYCITKEYVILQGIKDKEFKYDDETFDQAIISDDFKMINYFKLEDNKYIYFYKKPNIDKDLEYLEQIDYILTNKLNNGINDGELKHRQFIYIKYLNNLRKEQPLDVQFKEYDYIRVICENNNYNDIGIKDIRKCISFLDYDKEKSFLNMEEQILLRLIILLGTKNIYLNNTEYYKEKITDLNQIIEDINDYILFVKDNMNNVKEEILYSLDYQYSLNLKEYCSNIFVCLNDNYSVWNRNTSLYEKVDNEFIAFLRYISFDYYVSNKRFEEAQKIFEKELPLFKFLKESSCNSEVMILELIEVVLKKNYKYNEDEKHKQHIILNNILSSNDKVLLYNYFSTLTVAPTIKSNIKVMLKFYIDCYHYFVHFGNEENANMIYEYLLYFKDGYGIEDFIFKCRYVKMLEVLNGKKIDNIDNIEEVDIAINELEKLIDDMKLVNQFDIDDVENNYNNIRFSSFKKENREYVKRCIATGDKIMNTFSAIDIDFSNVVVEWSKAVETEMDEKLFANEIISYNDKDLIEQNFKRTDYTGKEVHFRLKKTRDITVGIFNDMENYTNGNQNLLNYLYERHFSRYYKLDEETYKKLCQYLKTISKPRNESAHKGKTIDKSTAMECKEKILASKKILEILSKLEKK